MLVNSNVMQYWWVLSILVGMTEISINYHENIVSYHSSNYYTGHALYYNAH